MKTDRRGWLNWLAKGIAGFCSASVVAISGRLILPPAIRDLIHTIDLGPLSELPLGTSTYLPAHDVYVFHEPLGLYALSARCTHLGCSVQKQPERFACPCHGALYDLQGTPLAGPSTRPLRWLHISLDHQKNLKLELDQTVEPGTYYRI